MPELYFVIGKSAPTNRTVKFWNNRSIKILEEKKQNYDLE